MVISFASGGDGFDLRSVVDRHHATQGIRCELLDEGFGEAVNVLNE